MLYTDYDTRCVNCAAESSQLLVPGTRFWEHDAIGRSVNNEFYDSEYDGEHEVLDTADSDTVGCSNTPFDVFDAGLPDGQPRARMYGKLAGVWQIVAN